MHPKTAAAPAASYPALPLQQGMIFHGLRVPDAGIDVVQCVIRWPGLDVPAYRAAWERAVARHAILRTGFPPAGDAEPVQVVWPDAALDFTVRTDALTGFLAADRVRGFAFDTPPLVRVTVLTHATPATGPTHATPATGLTNAVPVVVITLHHAVLDGRSLAMLLTEIDSDYEGRPDFPARTDYREFVEWFTARDTAERDRVFWTGHLAGVRGATPLPFGKTADPAACGGDQVARFTLTYAETVALQRVANSSGSRSTRWSSPRGRWCSARTPAPTTWSSA